MFTARRFGFAVITAASVGVGGILAAGAAHADGADDQYLGTLDQQGIGFGSPQRAIGIGHHVCDALANGAEPSDISANIAGANRGIDNHTALVIVVDAASAYCPQFVHHLPNGATVIGPNH
ncbi:DUF732 domain-containing protein [Mycobacterium sp. 1081908.1]|uniref:DUF732 domain-containing protein n=1 Tax=Mycobacterium sp. 1081908.1 TaxID=1834066 RepID=UPI0008024058|nr:DUF732 domain-containing protein [Mycobacterium sp. 1081908.1]OBK52832.1 hypothetical protein A5655_20950 [Mycobacterium sp. 1081908.1]